MPNKILRFLQAERDRWFLWLPVCLGAGMGIYFSLAFEPSIGALLPLLGLPALTRYGFRHQWQIAPLMLILSVVVMGVFWAKIHTDRTDVVMLKEDESFTTMQGRIVELSDVQGGYRITLDQVSIEDLTPEETPPRIRVKLRGSGLDAITGDFIRMRGGLLPPSGPVMPGAFDFARYFYFQGIGAVGYALPPVEVLNKAGTSSFDMHITAFRESLSARIRSHMPADEGGVAAALMTGDRAVVTDRAAEAMRATNLSHILAISGMHMAIVCGWVFFLFRFLLVLNPITQHSRYNKKYAACIALCVGAGYLLIAGIPISAARAFVMVALMLSAVLLDREVTPMRSLAWAALLLLLYDPSNLLEPGFQLSFAATLALLAFYEQVRAPLQRVQDYSYIKRLGIYLAGIFMTTLVAEFATAPFVLYHFNVISLYGLAANMVVMPLVTVVIMPSIMLAFVLLPLGAEMWPLLVAEWGIASMLDVAEWVSSWPHAEWAMPSMPAWGLVLLALGGCWLCIWQNKQRYWGLALIVLACFSWLFVHVPDVFISRDHKQIAARIDSTLYALKGRGTAFMPDQWRAGSGQMDLPYLKEHDAYQCDNLGCVLTIDDTRIAFPKNSDALRADCERAHWVIAPFYVSRYACRSKANVIDRGDLKDRGAHWLWLDGTARVGVSSEEQGRRPWLVYER